MRQHRAGPGLLETESGWGKGLGNTQYCLSGLGTGFWEEGRVPSTRRSLFCVHLEGAPPTGSLLLFPHTFLQETLRSLPPTKGMCCGGPGRPCDVGASRAAPASAPRARFSHSLLPRE